MNKFIISILLLSVSFSLEAQLHNLTKTEILKGRKYTYKVDFYDSDIIHVANTNNPEEFKENTNWKMWTKIKSMNPSDEYLINTYFRPYILNMNCDFESTTFLIAYSFDTNGYLAYMEFVYSAPNKIPIEGLENLEIEMKKQCKLTYEPEKFKVINFKYIMFTCTYPLDMIKEGL